MCLCCCSGGCFHCEWGRVWDLDFNTFCYGGVGFDVYRVRVMVEDLVIGFVCEFCEFLC